MSDDIGFRIVCTNCGCLSIRIDEPLKALRETIIYCGDCGTSRGTIGALRDLAVQRYSDVVFPMLSTVSLSKGAAADEPQTAGKMSKRYAELRRLRRQVEIAERLALVQARDRTHQRNKMQDMHLPGAVVHLDDKRDERRSH